MYRTFAKKSSPYRSYVKAGLYRYLGPNVISFSDLLGHIVSYVVLNLETSTQTVDYKTAHSNYSTPVSPKFHADHSFSDFRLH